MPDLFPLLLLLAVGVGCVTPGAAQEIGQAPITGERPFAAKPFRAEVLADLASPWALAFLPDGRMLVTEKRGAMLLLSADGRTRAAIAGVPAVDSVGQGALMDVKPHPDFARNRLIYFSYSAAGAGGKGVVLARGRLVERRGAARLEEVETLYRGHPLVDGDGHYSGRIAFSPDGFLFFTNGERQKFTPGQDPKASLGKVLRLTMDGRPAPGNPLAAKGFDPAIWSYGHRNLLGILFAPDGKLWEIEMGPKGGDEINLIRPGRNYGWPIVSNGDNYDGSPIPDHPTRPEYAAPKVSWNPSISPGDMVWYSAGLFPAWRGHLLVAGLSSEALIDVGVTGETAREVARYDMGQRIREVRQGDDGAVYLLEDGGRGGLGRLLRLTPRRQAAERTPAEGFLGFDRPAGRPAMPPVTVPDRLDADPARFGG